MTGPLSRRLALGLLGSVPEPAAGRTFDQRLAQLAAQHQLSVTVLLAYRGQPALARSFGKVRLDTIFALGSVIKLFTQHLTWTSAAEVMDGTMAIIRQSPLLFTPGTQYSYSNSGYATLGAIAARVSGQSYYDYVRAHIFAPAGTAPHMVRFARALTSGRLLGPAWAGLMTSAKVPLTPQQAHQWPPNQLAAVGYGPEVRIVNVSRVRIAAGYARDGREAVACDTCWRCRARRS